MNYPALALLLLAAGLLVQNFRYRAQIRRIRQQIAFVMEEESNLLVTADMSDRQLQQLVQTINRLIAQYTAADLALRKQDARIRSVITDLSHDIRTPLTSLDGYFQLIREAPDAQTREQYIRIIRQRITALKDMLEELFTYSKLQSPEFDPPEQVVQLNPIVYESLFSYYGQFSQASITPQVQITEQPVYALCNPLLFQRMVENIIKNSLVHGKAQVQVTFAPEGDALVFTCSNDVEHPEQINLEQVFERFYKADSARRLSSTGLGLAIARQIAERMRGSIRAALEGNVFTVTVTIPQIQKKQTG